jgi:DNA-directed RNA polymerase specialized sigma subunit
MEELGDWQRRARQKAEQHSRHQCKKAVQETTPTDKEAEALFALYRKHKDDIKHWCRQALSKAQGTTLTLDDVMAEAYILFQRSLVRYDEEKAGLRTYLQHDLRGRIRDYLEAVTEEQGEQEEPEDRVVAPGFDLVEIYEELIDEGRVSEEAEELWANVK